MEVQVEKHDVYDRTLVAGDILRMLLAILGEAKSLGFESTMGVIVQTAVAHFQYFRRDASEY